MQDFARSIDIPVRGDEYDGIRKEYGDMADSIPVHFLIGNALLDRLRGVRFQPGKKAALFRRPGADSLICFSLAALVGLSVYFLTRGAIGNSAAVLLMIGLMMPFFFFAMYVVVNIKKLHRLGVELIRQPADPIPVHFLFAMYERDGQPAEKLLKNRLRYKLWPKKRPYRTENLYKSMSKKEVTRIATGT